MKISRVVSDERQIVDQCHRGDQKVNWIDINASLLQIIPHLAKLPGTLVIVGIEEVAHSGSSRHSAALRSA